MIMKYLTAVKNCQVAGPECSVLLHSKVVYNFSRLQIKFRNESNGYPHREPTQKVYEPLSCSSFKKYF